MRQLLTRVQLFFKKVVTTDNGKKDGFGEFPIIWLLRMENNRDNVFI